MHMDATIGFKFIERCSFLYVFDTSTLCMPLVLPDLGYDCLLHLNHEAQMLLYRFLFNVIGFSLRPALDSLQLISAVGCFNSTL